MKLVIRQELQLRRVVPVQGREQLQTYFCQREAERDGRGLGAVRQHRHHHLPQVSHSHQSLILTHTSTIFLEKRALTEHGSSSPKLSHKLSPKLTQRSNLLTPQV